MFQFTENFWLERERGGGVIFFFLFIFWKYADLQKTVYMSLFVSNLYLNKIWQYCSLDKLPTSKLLESSNRMFLFYGKDSNLHFVLATNLSLKTNVAGSLHLVVVFASCWVCRSETHLSNDVTYKVNERVPECQFSTCCGSNFYIGQHKNQVCLCIEVHAQSTHFFN
jgi:hypothetical protein